MTLAQALLYIANSSGRIFCVEFVPRTKNELRQMTCRLGVRRHLKNGPAAYKPAEKGLVWVFDMTKQAYRSIPTEGLLRVKIDGEWQEVTP